MMSNEHVCATENMHSHLKHCTLHTAYSTTLFSITYSKLLFISFYFTSVLISSSLIYNKQNRTGTSSDLLSTVCKHTYNHVNMYKQKKKKIKKEKKEKYRNPIRTHHPEQHECQSNICTNTHNQAHSKNK